MDSQRTSGVIGPLFRTIGGTLNKRCSGYRKAGREPHYAPLETFPPSHRYTTSKHSTCNACYEWLHAMNNPVHNNDKKYDAVRALARNRRRHREKDAPFDETVEREVVWKLNLGICHLCLQPVVYEHAVMDHVYPLCRGGGWTWDNIRPAHEYCNSKKASLTMVEARRRGTLQRLRRRNNNPLALTS